MNSSSISDFNPSVLNADFHLFADAALNMKREGGQRRMA